MNLANALLIRFQEFNGIGDLEKSISLYHSSLELRPLGHPNRTELVTNLGGALTTLFERNGDAEIFDEAIEAYKHGAQHEFSSLLDRFRASAAWSITARSGRHHTSIEAYETALILLEAYLNVAPTLDMQHSLLAGKPGYSQPQLAVNAASHAIEQGDLRRAVEFLEQGRALLWMQLCGHRMTINDLAEVDEELTGGFKDVSQKLEALSTNVYSSAAFNSSSTTLGLTSDSHKLDEMMKQSRLLAEKRKEIIRRIRTVPGFEDFQRPTPFAKLQRAADDGPVILLNFSEYRSDALIVLQDCDPLLVPLSNDNPKFHEKMVELHKDLLDACRDTLRGLPKAFEETLTSVLETLWTLVVSKVVEKLKEIGITDGSRIWWCPTSVLQSPPFHAAGEWRPVKGRGVKYHSHKYISSYTPTLNALIQARSPLATHSEAEDSPSILFIVQEDESLESVRREIDEINIGTHCTYLTGEKATPDAMLESLKDHSWVHFACHGELESRKPFDASFRLSNDKQLTLRNIVGARVSNTGLAFLAACHTAEQTEGSVHNEVLHLAAGMQFCGFRSVIGTMWAMLDKDGPAFTSEFYKHMADDGMSEKGFQRSA